MYDDGRPLSDKKLFSKYPAKYPGAHVHQNATFQLQIP